MLNRIIPLLILALTALGAASQQRTALSLHTEDLPDARRYLPNQPDSAGSAFSYDVSQYYWGKEMRKSGARAIQARSDASYGIDVVARLFSTAFGQTVSAALTPRIFAMLDAGLTAAAKGVTQAKNANKRRRPFVVFGDPVYSTENMTTLAADYSYPSGHALRGWAMALLLAEVNPAAQEALLKRGYEYGQSRVIVGAHWQSDVDAGRLIAAACVARLHADPDFRELMRQAKEEYLTMQGYIFTEQPQVGANKEIDDDALYTIDGRPASADSHGVLVGKGKKVIVP